MKFSGHFNLDMSMLIYSLILPAIRELHCSYIDLINNRGTSEGISYIGQHSLRPLMPTSK